MKIDRRKPTHWLALFGFLTQGILGILLRLVSRRDAGLVLLYGHKLNGNLLALAKHMQAVQAHGLRPVFVNMDATYCREVAALGFRSQWACGLGCARHLATAQVVITDHGLHALQPLLPLYQKLGMRFVDVWHGVPFKGFDASDFRIQRRYNEVWVASESQRKIWISKFGFEPDRVHAIGYARTDRLVAARKDGNDEPDLDLPPADGKTILFAPTWAQDDRGRSVYPFDTDEEDFLTTLSAFATRTRARILLRSHLNSGNVAARPHVGIIPLPASRFPDTEQILRMSDVLVCDWSSIAFDFLLLDRPVVFLDVAAPFRKGFTLGPDYRFGAIVRSLPEMMQALENCMESPSSYWHKHDALHQRVKSEVFGSAADGRACCRAMMRLENLVRGND